MTLHSPGPWTACTQDDGHEPIVNGGNCLPVCEMYQIYGVPKETMEANANLIAAAPDLYAALNAFLKYMGDDKSADPFAPEEYNKLAHDARAALAKAVGVTS